MNAICEDCGLMRSEWKSNQGKGFERNGSRYCCQECFLGIGCSCKETGVRRIVVVNQEQNRNSYVKKMERQVKEWEGKVSALEKRAKDRQAEGNETVKKQMTELRRRIEKTRTELGRTASDRKAWPRSSRATSETYREMKELANSADAKIKRK